MGVRSLRNLRAVPHVYRCDHQFQDQKSFYRSNGSQGRRYGKRSQSDKLSFQSQARDSDGSACRRITSAPERILSKFKKTKTTNRVGIQASSALETGSCSRDEKIYSCGLDSASRCRKRIPPFPVFPSGNSAEKEVLF